MSSEAQPARVLCVDDDPTILQLVARTLTHHGHTPTTAASFEQALRLVDGNEFELAVLDIRLSNGDGVALLEEIKRRSPRTEVVMFSAHGTIQLAMRCVHAGAFDFIEKPFPLERFVHTVSRALEHRRLREVRTMYEAAMTMFATHDPERLPETVVKVSMDVMNADAVTLLLPGMDAAFYVAHAFGLAADVCKTTRIMAGQGIAGQVIATGQALVLQGDMREGANRDSRRNIRSSIVHPLLDGERVTGLLTFNRIEREVPFRAGDLATARALASQVLVALRNADLARQGATAAKLAAVGQMADGLAHEINTPLQIVRSGLDCLEDVLAETDALLVQYDGLGHRLAQSELPDDARHALEETNERCEELDLEALQRDASGALVRMREAVDRATHVVRSVARFGTSTVADRVPTDMNDCVLSTLTMGRSSYAGVADVLTDLADVPRVLGRPREICHVLLSLVVNAAHAIEEAVAGTARRGTIVVRTGTDATCAVVCVEDTGLGIPDEIRPRIFEPFFTTKDVGRGSGLGLCVARGIVEEHGGTLSFQTEAGRGTKFVVRIPLQP